ncbi:uncharacterized protein Z520_06602 [Fonsecaea multimorphosa CBS 102226]|uniref:Uncharacterized protein n=1 Tax=Fonsecaea multimorphosa CBS 102226 TaxID=1442371 RepID=A0A0D2K3Q9_9EURO|nr:uncharacterized protein Z520_06602 [Fonsecaea multimorphosa CBS 102226]KIX97824.1 hypothetical protein Z520_06602 [Fonsecaea multimorphosa CBS 102226]OAL23594.1 hypothetical protein AYO22_06171 [Fonsecaea multimorphosa]
MRLINAQTLAVEYFDDDKIPQYAILSHRWEEGEVLFEDTKDGYAKQKRGYAKVCNSARQALRDGLQYIWIDTCCINKDSSAELSEAINSMYGWYKNATKCYAYLSDVMLPPDEIEIGNSFELSAWFTRGWTLQELIAPSEVSFFDRLWRFIGTKDSLLERITTITGIQREALSGYDLRYFSVAQRMAWASSRITTRKEDIAYSLLGIFDVNMPMLYGEGTKAFMRLQEEIIKRDSDHSVFAWTGDASTLPFLADSPKLFKHCHDIGWGRSYLHKDTPYSMTNMGLDIELPLIPWSMFIYLALLRCRDMTEGSLIGIFIHYDPLLGQYRRTSFHGRYIEYLKPDLSRRLRGAAVGAFEMSQRLLIRTDKPANDPRDEMYGFCLGQCLVMDTHLENSKMLEVYARKWDSRDRIMELPEGRCGTVGVLVFRQPPPCTPACLAIKLGFDRLFKPVCLVWLTQSEPPRWTSQEAKVLDERQLGQILDSSWILQPEPSHFNVKEFEDIGFESVDNLSRSHDGSTRFLKRGPGGSYLNYFRIYQYDVCVDFLWESINGRDGYTVKIWVGLA